jgi:hypothetical protein
MVRNAAAFEGTYGFHCHGESVSQAKRTSRRLHFERTAGLMQAGLSVKLTGGQPVEESPLPVPGLGDGQWEQKTPFLRRAVCFRWFVFVLLFGPEDGGDL